MLDAFADLIRTRDPILKKIFTTVQRFFQEIPLDPGVLDNGLLAFHQQLVQGSGSSP